MSLPPRPRRGQMSEAFSAAVFLSVSGGLQDAYTYLARGEVFANAQTGNIVLLSQHLFRWDLPGTLRYFFPLASFALGVAAAEGIRCRCRDMVRFHWRQWVLLAEILLLLLVGFFPASMNLPANAIVSFSCAMQVQAFRKVDGCAFASTMCIGNLRSGVEAFCAYRRTTNREILQKAGRYFSMIVLFALGAGLGGVCIPLLGKRTIWLSALFLTGSFGLMFLREEREDSQTAEIS
ncbi:YoaK family protein [Oscillibacter sp.]|uniref:YoaK family protein n=1 Tax=Oscillibacter sp. TaxID=1945593 RepID=UPI0026026AE1|nr:YoaK family protein [Oscillibacter sp.]MDD3347353.1 YoaK family protein [Oscillibacter sp.]